MVSVTAAYVEVSHHFLRMIAERYLAHAHNPLSCFRVADTEQGRFGSPKRKMTKKCPGSAFPFAKQHREIVAPRESPFSSETSRRRAESDEAGQLSSSSRVTSSECPGWDGVKCTY